jgi:hypothetical protein
MNKRFKDSKERLKERYHVPQSVIPLDVQIAAMVKLKVELEEELREWKDKNRRLDSEIQDFLLTQASQEKLRWEERVNALQGEFDRLQLEKELL